MINATITAGHGSDGQHTECQYDRRFSSNFCANYRIMVHIVTAVIVINGSKSVSYTHLTLPTIYSV